MRLILNFALALVFVAGSYACADVIFTFAGSQMPFGVGGYPSAYILPILPEFLLPSTLLGYGLFAFGTYFFCALAGLAVLRSRWYVQTLYTLFALACATYAVMVGVYGWDASSIFGHTKPETLAYLYTNATYISLGLSGAFIVGLFAFKKAKAPQQEPVQHAEDDISPDSIGKSDYDDVENIATVTERECKIIRGTRERF